MTWTGVCVASFCVASCSSTPTAPVGSQSATGSSVDVSPTATPTITPTPTLPADASPLSGRAGGAGKPVLVVKLDNTTFAQPHAGLKDADVVFVEEVEFGLTRLAAVFSSTLPKVVGPIRSARISDIDLLKQFGRPAFAYSGAQHRMRPILGAASIYDVSGDKGGTGYFRDGPRRAPYDFMGHPTALLGRAPQASRAASIGYEFSLDTPARGRAARSVTATYPSSAAKFVWSPARSSYDVYLNRRPARAAEGGTQHASTVVIEYVKQHDSGFGDKYGGRTPKEETIGTGTGWVLRDGRAWQVTWSRPTGDQGTTYTDASGTVVAFAPGQVWVVLVNRTKKVALA
jgi:hypothetical protein